MLDTLDDIANAIVNNDHDGMSRYERLSTSEQLYVGLAANRQDLLGRNSIVGALLRIGDEWREALLTRWQYANYPFED